MQVTKYVHRMNYSGKGGICFKIEGDTDKVGSVLVQTARCSLKDHYSRKTGRLTCEKKDAVSVPLRSLPGYLSAQTKCKQVEWSHRPESFGYVVNNFLPKE